MYRELLIDILRGLKSLVTHYPLGVAFTLPWFVFVMPIAFMPIEWLDEIKVQEFTFAVSSKIPMINHFSARSSDVEWIKFALGALWVSGPFWVLTTTLIVLISRSLSGQRSVVVTPAFERFIGAGIMWAIYSLMLANVTPYPSRKAALAFHMFSTPIGLNTIGWCCFIFCPFVMGYVLADLLEKYVFEENKDE